MNLWFTNDDKNRYGLSGKMLLVLQILLILSVFWGGRNE